MLRIATWRGGERASFHIGSSPLHEAKRSWRGAGGEAQIAGKPATASGAYPGYPIAAGNDGVCDSGWNAGGYGGYWQVDLGATQSIRGVSFAVAGTPPSTVTATISVSTDGTTFTDKISNTVPDPGTITAYAFDFGANADARYVRFTLSSPASWVDIYEANVWQCP